MKNNPQSPWYNKDILPTEMKNRIHGKKSWPKLENSWHFKYLDAAIKASGKIETLIDLGCGGAEVGRVYPHIKYVGYDLEHMINQVAKKINPTFSYEYFDAFKSDFNFCKKMDVVLSNGFIGVLNKCDNYVILHRLRFAKVEKISNYTTYGGLSDIECFICEKEFNKMIGGRFEIIYSSTYDGTMKTLTLKKI